MSDTTLTLRLEGVEMTPTRLRARDVATLITALEDTIAAIVLRQSPELKRDMIRVSLVDVVDGSTELAFVPNLPSLTEPAVSLLADAIRQNRFFDLPPAAVKGMREIVGFIKAQRANALLRFGLGGSVFDVPVTADLDVFSTTELTGFTTLYGDILRLGGLQPKVEFKPINGQVLYCPASREIVLRLRDHLYQQVAAHGMAVWDAITMEVTDFEIQDFEPLYVAVTEEAMAEIKEQFGRYFDQIDDVDAWVSAVRRGDI